MVVTYDTFHGVRFTGRRLSVGEYRAVVTGQDVRYDALRRLIVDLFLGRVRFEDFVEQVYFTLKICYDIK